MDHATLTHRFDTAHAAMAGEGHGIIIRRARALLANGKSSKAVHFLKDAGTRTNASALKDLAEAVESWQGAGNQTKALVGTDAWQISINAEDQVARQIAALTEGNDLSTLTTRLAQAQKGLAALPPELAVAPSTRKAIGSIFAQRGTQEPQAVVESSHLVAKNMDLGVKKASEPPMPLAMPESTAPARVEIDSVAVPRSADAISAPPPFGADVTAPKPVVKVTREAVGAAKATTKAVTKKSTAKKATAKKAVPKPPPAVEPPSVELEPIQDVDGGLALWLGMAIFITIVVAVIYMARG